MVKIVAALPAVGWTAWFKDGGVEQPCPLVAWLVDEQGDLIPMAVDDYGCADDPRDWTNFIRLEHVR